MLPRVIDGVGKDTATIRTLRRALATIGSEERLAAALDCSPLDLVRWLSGEKPAPGEIFIAAGGFVGRFNRPEPQLIGYRDHSDSPPWSVTEIHRMLTREKTH